eukprot:4575357-Pyramimonas_sp.AAC.1
MSVSQNQDVQRTLTSMMLRGRRPRSVKASGYLQAIAGAVAAGALRDRGEGDRPVVRQTPCALPSDSAACGFPVR